MKSLRNRPDLPGTVQCGIVNEFRDRDIERGKDRVYEKKMAKAQRMRTMERLEGMDPKLRVIRDTKGTVAQHSRMATITLPKLKFLEEKGGD